MNQEDIFNMKICNRKDNCSEIGKRCCPLAIIGPTGPTGPQGVPGGIINYADFYALMPPDNVATVAVGGDVDFPQDGPNSGGSISRLGVDSFNLLEIGVYQVYFNVPVTEAG